MLRLKAYAKINLGLQILRQREDGYHDIESILQTVNFFDEIEISFEKKEIEFICATPPLGKDNLCYKAADLFLSQTKLNKGVKIKLKKHIWIGAGLGGGSSCAAQTLIGINKLFDNPLGQNTLLKLASQLGSDVPFFLAGGTAHVKGRGNIIELLIPLKTTVKFVLVYPKLSTSTKWAYSNIKNYLTKRKWDFKILVDAFLKDNIKSLAKNLHNDFEPLVFKTYPKLRKIEQRLFELGALGVSLSGSGSCIYGLFNKLQNKERLEERLSNLDVQIKVVEPINPVRSLPAAGRITSKPKTHPDLSG